MRNLLRTKSACSTYLYLECFIRYFLGMLGKDFSGALNICVTCFLCHTQFDR